MLEVDAVLLGAGGAGVAVLHQVALALERRAAAGTAGPRPLRVAVLDPVDRLVDRPADRTWCSWLEHGSRAAGELAPAVHRWWRRALVVGADGSPHELDLGPLRYAMVRSEDYYGVVARAVHSATARGLLELLHRPVAAGAVEDGERRARVTTPAGAVGAAWVLDSRPAPPVRPGATALVQAFRGERVRTPRPSVDPELAVLMDFSVPQPARGLAFGYCLPSDSSTALVEHTVFAPAAPGAQEQAAALGAYRRRALGTAAGDVEHEEAGAIPMTDAVFARRTGRRVLRLGTAGGAVRPSTGYAFTAMQRAARALAGQLVAGEPLAVPRPYPRRHAWMDALVLRALADGSLDGPAFFTHLLTANPPERVLRFLDGRSRPGEEVALMATAPRAVMLRALARDAAWRARAARAAWAARADSARSA